MNCRSPYTVTLAFGPTTMRSVLRDQSTPDGMVSSGRFSAPATVSSLAAAAALVLALLAPLLSLALAVAELPLSLVPLELPLVPAEESVVPLVPLLVVPV